MQVAFTDALTLYVFVFHSFLTASKDSDDGTTEEAKSRKKTNRQMLQLVRKFDNDTAEAARCLVEGFMRIPVDRRSDEMAEKVEKEINRYRKKVAHLLEKDKKRFFNTKGRAHQLDDSFAKVDSHPSLFGTQQEDEIDDDSLDSSDRDSDLEDTEAESNAEMEDDVDELSQRLSQLTQTKERKTRGKAKRYKKALNDPTLEDQTRRKRLRNIRTMLKDLADRNRLSLTVLIGMVLRNECYLKNRVLARVADCIIKSDPIDPFCSIQESIYIREECLLTKATYFRLRQRLLAHGIELPAEKRFRDGAAALRPPLEMYEHKPGKGAIGVKAKFKPALEHTFRDIMDVVERSRPDLQEALAKSGRTKEVTATVKYGLDGSGGHREIGKSKETNVISGKSANPCQKSHFSTLPKTKSASK